MPEALVVAKDASRRFGQEGAYTEAVRGANCAVLPEQRIALMGPSGSGKSTLLHLLGGLDLPTAGSVAWPGLGAREGLRPGHVVDVFQGPSLLPALSVVENVRLPLLLQGMTEHEARLAAGEALERFGAAHLGDKLPEEISGGQAQRVGIARALAGEPSLVLADEPTGQLDSTGAEEILRTFLDVIVDLGAAVIVATHDARVAAQFAITWQMNDGRLETGVPCST